MSSKIASSRISLLEEISATPMINCELCVQLGEKKKSITFRINHKAVGHNYCISKPTLTENCTARIISCHLQRVLSVDCHLTPASLVRGTDLWKF